MTEPSTTILSEECAICFGFLSPGAVTVSPCNHTFDLDCICTWIKQKFRKPTCPLCREPIQNMAPALNAYSELVMESIELVREEVRRLNEAYQQRRERRRSMRMRRREAREEDEENDSRNDNEEFDEAGGDRESESESDSDDDSSIEITENELIEICTAFLHTTPIPKPHKVNENHTLAHGMKRFLKYTPREVDGGMRRWWAPRRRFGMPVGGRRGGKGWHGWGSDREVCRVYSNIFPEWSEVDGEEMHIAEDLRREDVVGRFD